MDYEWEWYQWNYGLDTVYSCWLEFGHGQQSNTFMLLTLKIAKTQYQIAKRFHAAWRQNTMASKVTLWDDAITEN